MEHRQPQFGHDPTRAVDPQAADASWWSDPRLSGWDRVQEAFRRDWEQTKADLAQGAGHDLHQTAGDTLKQASGDAAVPRMSQPTRPSTAADARRAKGHLVDESRKVVEAVASAQSAVEEERAQLRDRTHDLQVDLAVQYARVTDTISDATLRANRRTQKAQGKVREALLHCDGAREAWIKAEREASYGFAARAHYLQHPDWTPELETTLRGEWIQVKDGGSWDDARHGVRGGWELFQRQKH